MASPLSRRTFLIAPVAGAVAGVRPAEAAQTSATSANGDVITSRVVSNIGTSAIRAGSPLQFAAAFRRGDVPAARRLKLEIGGVALSHQLDGRTTWADGSLKFAEIRAYLPRPVAVGQSLTLRIRAETGAYAGAPDRGGVVAFLSALKSVRGADDLLMQISSLSSATGQPPHDATIGSGRWICQLTDVLRGPHVQQINSGPLCVGFRAFGPFRDGKTPHAHLHGDFYVWVWFNSDGTARAVEYIFAVQNGLIMTALPPDRYNYDAEVKNGTASISRFVIPKGTRTQPGGHHHHARWYTARADGRTNWIGVVPPTIHVSLDRAAQDYLIASGLAPKWDTSIRPSPPPAVAEYTPFTKGVFGPDETVAPYNRPVAVDQGGDSRWIGLWPNWCVRAFLLQTPETSQICRVTSLAWGVFPYQVVGADGRVPVLIDDNFDSLDKPQPATFYIQNRPDAVSNHGISLPTEDSLIGQGDWTGSSGSTSIRATTHLPSPSVYTYLTEGGRHHLDLLILNASGTLLCKSPTDGFTPRRRNVAGHAFDGVIIGSTLAPREDAWGFREVAWAGALCPDRLADGKPFGEKAYFRKVLSENCAWAPAAIGQMSRNERANGFWTFRASGSDDPWMQSYLAQAAAQAYRALGDEAFAGGLAAFCRHHRKYFEGWGRPGDRCSFLLGAQTINVRSGLKGPFKSSWSEVGVFVPDLQFNPFQLAAFDAESGWITITGANGKPEPPGWPISVNDPITFVRDYFADFMAAPVPPPEIEADTKTYYIREIDKITARIRVSASANGPSIRRFSRSVAHVYFTIVNMQTCPAHGYLWYKSVAGNVSRTLLGIRAYRGGGFDSEALAHAESNCLARLQASAKLNYSTEPCQWLVI